MPLEAIFSNLRLYNITKEILRNLDLHSLARVELVCKAWRTSILETAVWKCKLMALAKKVSFSTQNIEQKLATATDKEDLLKVCRSICWNLQHSEKWLAEGTVNMTKRTFGGPQEVRRVAKVEDGMVIFSSKRTLLIFHLDQDSQPTEIPVPEDFKTFERMTCIDVFGDYVAVGRFFGPLAICNWRRGTWHQGNREGLLSIAFLKFHQDGEFLATAGPFGGINIWSFRDDRLNLVQEVDLDTRVQGIGGQEGLDLAGNHVISCQVNQVIIYRVDRLQEDGKVETVARHEFDFRDELTAVAVLRSMPGIVVTSHWSHNLRVWDLERGTLLHRLPAHSEFDYMKECPETGLLVLASFAFRMDYSTITLIPTSAVAFGMADATGVRISLPDPTPLCALGIAVFRSGVEVLVYRNKSEFDVLTLTNGPLPDDGVGERLAAVKEPVALAGTTEQLPWPQF